MAVESKLQRCAEDDPNRCQAVVANGQCPYLSLPNTKNCAMHGGVGQQNNNGRQAVSNYRLQQYQERVSDFANNSEIKSLREEIGIVRMTLESLLVSCKDANKLLLYSDKITNMVNQIQKLVVAAQSLEEKNNTLLGRNVVIVIADSIVTLLGQYITDPDKLVEIGNKIHESIEIAASPTNILGAATEIHNGT